MRPGALPRTLARPLRRAGRPHLADVLLAGVVTALTAAGSVAVQRHAVPQHQAVRSLDAAGYLLLVAAGAGLAWRRRVPTPVLVWVFGWVTCYDRFGFPHGPAYLPLIIAFVTAVISGDRRIAYAVLAAGFLLSVQIRFSGANVTVAVGIAAWLLVLAAGAEIVRIRARARAAEAAQAARAEQARVEQARRRAGEQRLRIAQDLHDVLAHQLALISVQANAALALRSRQPERADEALRAIKVASNTALAELHHVLDALRTPDPARGDTPPGGDPAVGDRSAPRRPAPLLSRAGDIDLLVDGTRAAGLTVHGESDGTVRTLPVAVDQTGYRIVQEALTNAVRHAGPGATVLLRVEYRGDALRLVIRDDGRGTPNRDARGGGNGLPGMRERVVALGGTLVAGRVADGGFQVAASLPLVGTP